MKFGSTKKFCSPLQNFFIFSRGCRGRFQSPVSPSGILPCRPDPLPPWRQNFFLRRRLFSRIRVRLKDLYEARLLLEPELAAIASGRAAAAELSKILEIGASVERTICEGKDRTEIDRDFHRSIVRASHHDFMPPLVPIINRAVTESILLNYGKETPDEDILLDHALLMEFLKKWGSGGAKQAMFIQIHAISTLDLNSGEDPIF